MGTRPIVSSCESPTENISQFIDHRLQLLMKALPSYLKDTTQLINDLRDLPVEPDTLLVTVDIKSLYTCIPHSGGVEACKEALCSFVDSFSTHPYTEILPCLLKIVLKITYLANFINNYREQQWVPNWLQPMPIYSWVSWKTPFFPMHP